MLKHRITFFLFVDWMERHKWHLMVTELFYINDFFLLLFYRIKFYSVVFMAICEFFIVQNRIIDETILCIKINAWHKINQWNFIFDIFAAKFIFYCMIIFGEIKNIYFFLQILSLLKDRLCIALVALYKKMMPSAIGQDCKNIVGIVIWC